MILDVAHRRSWNVRAAMVTETHIHSVPSWRSNDLAPEDVQATFKRLLGLTMARRTKIKGRRWISDGGKPQRVRARAHLNHLKYVYLPKHLGKLWLEDYVAR